MFAAISEQLNSGILLLDLDCNIVYWNRFMAIHANKTLEQVQGKSVFEVFPELPERWFLRKIRGVTELGTPSFCSWEQRHHLFEMPHHRPITTGNQLMAQNCTFSPIEKEGKLAEICILVEDATDVCFYQSSLKEVMENLELANRIDGLTQIYNRKYWQECIESNVSRAKRYGGELTLIMFDLDHFKKLNDNHGHQCGDLVLVETAQRISSILRSEDIFGRYGGEEFAIILPETDLLGASEVAERIRTAISEVPIIYNGKEINFSASIGIATLKETHKGYEALIGEADEALYSAKSMGRNQVMLGQVLHKHTATA